MPQAVGQVGWRRARDVGAAPEPASRRARRAPAPAGDRWRLAMRLTYLVVALYALTFASLSILKHESFGTNAFDLGNMDQAVWNTAQGRWFQFTNWEGGDSRLAAHVEPILLLVAQIYRLYASPHTLLVLQSVAISLGALPAFWLARDTLKNEFAAVTFASAYLLSPALEAANLADFHAVALASSFLIYAFYCLRCRRYPLFFVFAVLAMSTKEQVPLSIALLGLYIALAQRDLLPGALAMGLGVAWFAVAMGVVIPAFNPTGASPYLSRYDQLGASPRDILLTFLTDPGRAAALASARVDYVRSLLEPVAYVSLLSPFTLAPALPDLAVNVFSNFPWMYSGVAHYGSVIAPFVVIAAIQGSGNLVAVVGRLSEGLGRAAVYPLSAVVLFASAASYYTSVFLPLSDHLPAVTAHDRLAEEFIDLIPAQAAVASSSALNPHVSQRQRLYLYPDVRDAEYIFLDVSANPYPIDHPSQRWRVENLLRADWGIVAARDGYLLLRRGAAQKELGDEFFSFARADKPRPAHPLAVSYGPSLRLLGYAISPEGAMHGRDPYAHLSLYWQLAQPAPADYLISVLVVAPNGQVLNRQSYHAATVWYPTSRWRLDEVVRLEVERVPLDGYPTADLLLGVIDGPNERDASRRLSPVPEGDNGQLDLREDGTLLKLHTLRLR